MGAVSKAAHKASPGGFRQLYIPCVSEESAALLDQYEKSGDPDIAKHLIVSLNTARRERREEATAGMNFSGSSGKSWALICQLSAYQHPPRTVRPPATANAVAHQLVEVVKSTTEGIRVQNPGWVAPIS